MPSQEHVFRVSNEFHGRVGALLVCLVCNKCQHLIGEDYILNSIVSWKWQIENKMQGMWHENNAIYFNNLGWHELKTTWATSDQWNIFFMINNVSIIGKMITCGPTILNNWKLKSIIFATDFMSNNAVVRAQLSTGNYMNCIVVDSFCLLVLGYD